MVARGPTFGQCAVTSLVVRDYIGGEVRIAHVIRDGEPVDMHCWLELPDGATIDWTTEQFDFEYELGEPIDLTPIVDETGVDRHRLLARRVAARWRYLASRPRPRTRRRQLNTLDPVRSGSVTARTLRPPRSLDDFRNSRGTMARCLELPRTLP